MILASPASCESARAAIDRRHGEVELGAAPLAGQRDANRMEERLPLLPGLLLHPVRHRAERVAIEQRPVDRLGERGDHLARARLVQHLGDRRALRAPRARRR